MTDDRELSASARTILQIFQARKLFIGDELRIASLRSVWTESGRDPAAFAAAISELQAGDMLRGAHGHGGAALRLTQTGFRQMQAKPTLPAQAPNRRKPLQRTPSAATVARPQPPASKTAPTRPPQTNKHPPAQPLEFDLPTDFGSDSDDSVAVASAFRNRSPDLGTNVLKHVMLGLFRHHRVRASGSLRYEMVLKHWQDMELAKPDLICAIDALVNEGLIETVVVQHAKLVLTGKGHRISMSPPASMDDGMDRWRAKKLLRMTKQLGAIPAA